MTRNLRILTTSLWALAILSMCALLASWTTSKILRRTPPTQSESQSEPTRIPNLQSPSFSFTDQNNTTFSSDALKGKVWIANFIFTTCQGPCPLMSAKMATLVKQLPDPNIHFVSFSVDPETDTPAVLKEYAAKLTKDPRWHFLTGGPDNAVYNLAKDFKLLARPADGLNPIFHATKFVLVTPTGQVAGYYTYNDPASLEQLAKDAQQLANSLPK